MVIRFANLNDAMQYKKLVNLFTDDASFARPTEPDNFISGKANILAAFEARPGDRITRHIVSNVLIDVISETRARGCCYAVLYTGSADNHAEKFGIQANASQYIGEFYDDFVLTDEGWKIARRSGKIVFTT